MASTGNFTAQFNIINAPSGQRTFSNTRTFSAAVDYTNSVALINGATTVTVPSGATFCGIFPPNAANPQPNPSYSGTITLKGVSGDTGVPISSTYPTFIEWDSATAPSSFVLAATSAGTVEVVFA